MYLKSLELVGFKSFADKTKLEFEPGMTAIVGPNGCGKSNIADAIRWVIGETSPKALRGSKMEDCIFNGTDGRKPLGMAEVSITFSDSEKALGTDFNEVTVTRRVFRSGEGQYFINRTPCRLKDIQRLFMDTGVGTVSYSLMEQGRIDRVLSSHPEDRRTIFEEASGITKFKNDKAEALRKLEHTEANLLRLADVIREVKRQIGSLQRQAGKARTYKTLRDELRRLDIHATRENLTILDGNIQKVEGRLLELSDEIRAAHAEVEQLDAGSSTLREGLMQTDQEIASVHEAGVQAQTRLDHTREQIATNRQRIEEYRVYARRDSSEIDEHRRQTEDKRRVVAELAAQLERIQKERNEAEEQLKAATGSFTQHQQMIDGARRGIQALRQESVQMESTFSRLQNELVEIESRERQSVIRRERLSAEKAQVQRAASSQEKREGEIRASIETLRQEVASLEAAVRDIENSRTQREAALTATRQQFAELQSAAAGRQAEIGLLCDAGESEGDFSGGARFLMADPPPPELDRSRILGALAAHLEVDPPYATALEAVLRAWVDAIVVKDADAALSVLALLESRKAGPARILAAGGAAPDLPARLPGPRLVDHVKCPDSLHALLLRLLGGVAVVDSLAALSLPLPPGVTAVTVTGSVLHANGAMEFWMTDARPSNPLARKNALSLASRTLSDIEQQLARQRAELTAHAEDIRRLDADRDRARSALNERARAMAQREGEHQIVSREAQEAREHLETVSFELDQLVAQGQSGDSSREKISGEMQELRRRRDQVSTDVNAQNHELQQLETRHFELQNTVAECRIRFAGLTQKAESVGSQKDAVDTRIRELQAAIEGRAAGVQSYEAGIRTLTQEMADAEARLSTLETSVKSNESRVTQLREGRERQAAQLAESDRILAGRREKLETLRATKSELEVRHAESRMRRQNQVDRVTSEHALTLEQLLAEPAPVWEGDAPTLDSVETQIAELRTKIEAMGPVNLVAIEEYRELEERYTFLTHQEQDLVSSKQQLMEMIRTINKTTSEMFAKTFAQVNEHFQVMFHKLFGGGTAKLVLVNEEDVLECGIEIIARPPGKRLQNVSLLSGGERTLTAVALLFSIYLIKPSPFCMLDELDAALDETNIGRFVTVLKDFLSMSQFVVITHNRNTISAGHVVYGITMPEKGISKIVSMKFSEYVDSQKARQPPAPKPEAVPAETAGPAGNP